MYIMVEYAYRTSHIETDSRLFIVSIKSTVIVKWLDI